MQQKSNVMVYANKVMKDLVTAINCNKNNIAWSSTNKKTIQ